MLSSKVSVSPLHVVSEVLFLSRTQQRGKKGYRQFRPPGVFERNCRSLPLRAKVAPSTRVVPLVRQGGWLAEWHNTLPERANLLVLNRRKGW
jgi:hypothetical protein